MIYDEAGKPVAVVIPIDEWNRLPHEDASREVDLSPFYGRATFGGRDALEMQKQARMEWDIDRSR
jgi:hypothetical protein